MPEYPRDDDLRWSSSPPVSAGDIIKPFFNEHMAGAVVGAEEIQALARDGQAPGQCAECGSFRLDGQPPYLHEPWCSRHGELRL